MQESGETASATQSETFTTLKQLPGLYAKFARDPIAAMKTPVRFAWPLAILIQTSGAALSGVIAALLTRNYLDFFVAVLIFPIIALIASSVMTFFLFYFFAGFASTYLDLRRLNSIVILSTQPFFIIHAFSGFLAPLDLIGFAGAMVLLTVGLVEQFALERRLVFKTLGFMFAAFFAVWSLTQIYLSARPR